MSSSGMSDIEYLGTSAPTVLNRPKQTARRSTGGQSTGGLAPHRQMGLRSPPAHMNTYVRRSTGGLAPHRQDPPAPLQKKKRGARHDNYVMYIYKVLRQVHPEMGISCKAMSIVNSFVKDIFERIAGEAKRLSQYNRRLTISSREIQTAVRLLLPGELAKHAVSEGSKAVIKYMETKEYDTCQRSAIP